MTGYVPQNKLAEWRENNKPEQCPILGHEAFDAVVDHDHKTGRIRGVVSREGNALLGKIENFYRSRCVCAAAGLPEVLRACAEYLEQEQGPLHPVGVRQVTRRFRGQLKAAQVYDLKVLGASEEQIAFCKNSKERGVLFRNLWVKRES